MTNIKLYFSDYFSIQENDLESYGAFNISLVSDLPLFIDPFLLFNSPKSEYQKLHENIISYLKFLRNNAVIGKVDSGLLNSWYVFREVKQNWFGFTVMGNGGSGLGTDFAQTLHNNLNQLFKDFGKEKVTSSSHLEKLCLISDGVGKDNISDFATNLIKEYLLEYTQSFAVEFIKPELRERRSIPRVHFNYGTEIWEAKTYELPIYNGDFVLLTPKDLLTKNETWINRSDLIKGFDEIPDSIPDDHLRSQISNYLRKRLEEFDQDREPTKAEKSKAIQSTIREFPTLIDYYIKLKEDHGDEAQELSGENVEESKLLFVDQARSAIEELLKSNAFYAQPLTTYEEALDRVIYFKDFIENRDGYRLMNVRKNGKPISNEKDVQLFFGLVWYGTVSDVNREPNNGRGPVDIKVSRGVWDKTLIEFKLGSNSQLKRNLEKQVAIYEKANGTRKSVKVIVCYTEEHQIKVAGALRDLNLENEESIIVIDARDDNKPSASKA